VLYIISDDKTFAFVTDVTNHKHNIVQPTVEGWLTALKHAVGWIPFLRHQ